MKELTIKVLYNEETKEFHVLTVVPTITPTEAIQPQSQLKRKVKEKVEEIEDDIVDDVPRAILLSNKLEFNDAALEAMGVSQGDKISVVYLPIGDRLFPMIGKTESLNLYDGLTLFSNKSIKVLSSRNETLSKYGTEFTLVKYNIDGGFILDNDSINFQNYLLSLPKKTTGNDIQIEIPETTDTDVNQSTVEVKKDDNNGVFDFNWSL